MRKQIQEIEEFNIISRRIDNASKCKVIEVCEDCFKVKLKRNCEYEADESVELFAMTNKGQLYFETMVKEADGDILSIWFPITYKYLQKREFSRITTENKITLINNEEKITANLIDISAGGLKLTTKKQLQLQTEYKAEFQIENKEIECIFEPIRIEYVQGKFISSGRFKDLKNHDRITLVQYCFRKQIENSNK